MFSWFIFPKQVRKFITHYSLLGIQNVVSKLNFKGKTRSVINVGNCSISSRVLYLIFCSKAKLVVLMLGIVFLS